MAIKRPAPRVDTTRPADFAHSIADITSGNVDLTAIALKPKHAAGLLRLNNATAAALTAVLVPEQHADSALTISVVVNASSQYELPVPIKSITASGSGALSAVAYWWAVPGTEFNPA
jgi:hypothetical protein